MKKEIPAGEMRDVQLVGVDLDGTLLRSDKLISKETERTLYDAKEAGITVVPVTGRPLDGIPDFLIRPGVFRYAITSNGAAVHDLESGELLAYEGLGAETALRVFRAAPELNIIREAMIGGRAYLEQDGYDLLIERWYDSVFRDYIETSKTAVPDMEELLRAKEPHFQNDAYHHGLAENLSFLTEVHEELVTLMDALEEIPGILVTVYNEIGCDVGSAASDKGLALMRLASRLGIPGERVCAIGDSPNDLSMLQTARFSCAVANACGRVREAASFITEDNDHEGAANVLRLILGQREL